MKDDRLSSEEIRGLLNNPASPEALTGEQLDVLKELFCTALGGTAALRDPFFPKGAGITGPTWSVKSKDVLFTETQQPVYIALGEFTGTMKLPQIVTVDQQEVEQAVAQLAGEQAEAAKLFEIVQETMTRLFASASASLSMLTDQETGYSLSGIDILEAGQKFPFTHFTKEQWFAEALFTLSLGDHHNVSFRMYLPAGPCIRLTEQLAGIAGAEEAEETEEMSSTENQQPEKNTQQPTTESNSHSVQSVQFSSFDEVSTEQSVPNNLNMLMDIPLQVTVELGRTKRMVKEILEMSQGSIVELDKLAGEPVDILINNKLIAVGEVVVIDENFGVRVTDILSTAERISKLR